MKRYKYYRQQGQALITLLLFMVIVITVTSGAVVVIFVNSAATTKYEQSQRAYTVAESGVEDAMVRILRTPSFTNESLSVDDGIATVTVSGSGPYTVTSTGVVGNFNRTIQAVIGYTNNILTVMSWSEI